MIKYILYIVFSFICLGLSGCVVETVNYDSGYSNDYVYSVGYYNTRPYWGNNYYYYGYPGYPYSYWGSYDYMSFY